MATGDVAENSSDKKDKEDDRLGVGCWLAIILVAGAIIALFIGLNYWRGLYGEPDRVHDARFGNSNGRQMAYLMNSKLIDEDEDREHLDEHIYRLDVIDLGTGERASRFDLGDRPVRWLGSNGSVAWLVSARPEIGLEACDLKSETTVRTQEQIVAANAGTIQGPFDTLLFDARSGGAVVRTSGGSCHLIEPGTFKARPFNIDSLLPPPQTTAIQAYPHGAPSNVAYRSATLDDGTALEFSHVSGRLLRGAWHAAIGPEELIDGGIVYDSETRKPLSPGAPGTILLLHFEEDDEDADFILTTLAPDGKTIWRVTEEALESGGEIRSAHMLGNDLIIVTDEDILLLDPASGRVIRRIDL
jgi:hypothetical protein